MRKKDFKKLLLNKKTIADLNGNLMEAIKGGNRDPHDPTWSCDTGGGFTYTCYPCESYPCMSGASDCIC